MMHSPRGNQAGQRQQLRPYASSAWPMRDSEHLRLARGLLGATPAHLAARFGAATENACAVAPPQPGYTDEHLALALRAVIGWYQTDLGTEVMPAPASAGEPMTRDSLMPHYLAVRSEWENRAATAMVARLNGLGNREITQPAEPAMAPEVTRSRALLVDDVADVVITVGAYLDALGFEVIRAPTGDAALAVLANGAEIDLLITDHAMPGMSGKDLVTQARELLPSLRALIITGYPDADELGLLPEGVMLLAKPFRRPELAECVQQVFAARHSGTYGACNSLVEANGF